MNWIPLTLLHKPTIMQPGTWNYIYSPISHNQPAIPLAYPEARTFNYSSTVLLQSTNNCMRSYRYGFNGMEKDDEVKGSGNHYTTQFRQYDTRIGRWLSLDPLFAKFPHQSPYVAYNNNPIRFADPTGLKGKDKVAPAGYNTKKGADGSDLYLPSNATVDKVFRGTDQNADGKLSLKLENAGVIPTNVVNDGISRFSIDNRQYTAYFNSQTGDFINYRSSDGVVYENPIGWNSVADIELSDFVTYSSTGDCEDAARKCVNNSGSSPGWKYSGIMMEADNSLQPSNDNLSVDRKSALKTIDAELATGKAVMVGLSYSNGTSPTAGNSDNRNKLVGHFVVIVGSNVEGGNTVYYYWDNYYNGTDTSLNKLILESSNRLSNTKFFVADVRPNTR